MLNEVLETLAIQGWFDPGQDFEKTIFLTQGAAQSMLLSRRGTPIIFVKFSDRSSLALEAQRSEIASQRFPEIAPGYIGYARREAFEVLATRAVSFRAVDEMMLRRGGNSAVVQKGLEQLFSRMRSAAWPAADRGTWLAEYRAYFRAHPLRRWAELSLDRLLAALGGLPAQAQHCDLVVNNLGLNRTGGLSVFDWEDYGAVDVPGLDLFTLEFSLRGALTGGPDHGRQWRDSPTGRGLDVERLCQAMQLPHAVYGTLQLSYAFVFRFLKRNYGSEVRSRVDSVLSNLIAQSGGDVA